MSELGKIHLYSKIISENIFFKNIGNSRNVKYEIDFKDRNSIADEITLAIKHEIKSALESSNFEFFEYFIDKHPLSNIARKYFLIEAIKIDNEELFRYLHLHRNQNDDYQLLYYCIYEKDLKYFNYILNGINDINIVEYKGTDVSICPLYIAINNLNYSWERYKMDGTFQIIKLLLDKGADPNIDLHPKELSYFLKQLQSSPGFDHEYHRHLFIKDPIPIIIKLLNEKGYIDLLSLFLKYNTDVQFFNLSNFLKFNNFEFEVLSIFIEAGYDFSNYFNNYQFGFNPNKLDQQIEGLLQYAPLDTIRYLLQNSDFLGKHDIKLLYYSAMAGRQDVVELLVTLGANVSALKPESLAKIFYSGAPMYRRCTKILNEDESLTGAWYSGDIYEREDWYLSDERRAVDNNRRLITHAESLLNSFSDRLVYYLICHGAPIEWHKSFKNILKNQILWEESILEGQEIERSDSIRQLSQDGWNAAFEISSWEGDFNDYI